MTHCTAYLRGVFPSDEFVTTAKWGVCVWQCRDDAIIAYVAQHIETALTQVQQGFPTRLIMKIYRESESIYLPLEQLVFEIRQVSYNDPRPTRSDESASVQRALQTSLLKIGMCTQLNAQLPPDCTFVLAIDPPIGSVHPALMKSAHKTPEWLYTHHADQRMIPLIDKGAELLVGESHIQMWFTVPMRSEDADMADVST